MSNVKSELTITFPTIDAAGMVTDMLTTLLNYVTTDDVAFERFIEYIAQIDPRDPNREAVRSNLEGLLNVLKETVTNSVNELN